jgi:hypothetical protein
VPQTRGRARFSELAQQRKDAEARAAAAEKERDELKARLAQPSPAPAAQTPPAHQAQPEAPAQPAWTPPATRPEPSEDEIGEKYTTYAAFTKDQALWVWEQARAKEKAQEQQEKQQQQQRDWATSYTSALADAKMRYPDYDTQVAQVDAQFAAQQVVIPQVLLDAIVSSPRGPDVSYYLATHQDEYRALIQEAWGVNHPQSIALVRRVLEAKLPAVPKPNGHAQPAAISQAPAPFAPVGTGSKTTVPTSAELADKGTMDYDKSGFRERRAAERGIKPRRWGR